jgi:molybdopterin-containing oxidoreductase family iron-sulfur binding subunit
MKAKDRAAIEKREVAEGEYIPACAEVCPAKAISFGDLSDERSHVSRLAKSSRAFRLMEELGTKPKVIYLAEQTDNG